MPFYLQYLGHYTVKPHFKLFRLKNRVSCICCKEIDLQEWLSEFDTVLDGKQVAFHDEKNKPINYNVEKIKEQLRAYSCCQTLSNDIIFLTDDHTANCWLEKLEGKRGDMGPRILNEFSSHHFIISLFISISFGVFLSKSIMQF